MALTRGKLSNVVVVGAASTAGIVTCASSKKVYVKSVLAHAGTGASTRADIYFIPNRLSTLNCPIIYFSIYTTLSSLLCPQTTLTLSPSIVSIFAPK